MLTKTWGRMVWYFKEIMPLFLLASLLIWLGNISGVLELIARGLGPLMRALGLPDQTANVFLFGFFRRDFGVAWLYDMHRHGIIRGNQLVVSAVTLTLFLPCVAQFLVMSKERGLRTTLALSVCVAVVALAAGMLVHLTLEGLGVRL